MYAEAWMLPLGAAIQLSEEFINGINFVLKLMLVVGFVVSAGLLVKSANTDNRDL